MLVNTKVNHIFLAFACTILFVMLASYSINSYSEGNVSPSDPQDAKSREDLVKASKEIDRLEAEIQRQQEELGKRPRKKFVGARTKDYRLALYVEKWRKKIEKVGNQNYPKVAAAERIYGKVQATVSIMANGTVEFAEINKSSGHKILDDHVLDTIKRAAPYEPFDDNLKKDVDILSITRTWQYLSEPVAGADGAENWFLEEVEN